MRRANLKRWFDAPDGQNIAQGYSRTCIALKAGNSGYIFEPTNVNPTLVDAVLELDEVAVMTMSSHITSGVLELINPYQKSLTTEQKGHRLPIVTSLSDVTSDMAHFSRACIIKKEQLILIWSDSPDTLMDVGSDIEMQLFNLVISTPDLQSVR